MTQGDSSAFIVEDAQACYLDPAVRDTLGERRERALEELAECRACPRFCGVNRMAGETKFCHVGRHARVSSAFAHMGEEDCLRGWAGSGTIFFTMCNLRCVFCQNWDISQQETGVVMDATALADLMLQLQHHGCHNINLVTPEHIVPQAVEALVEAIERGLTLPVVYNTSGYDALESLALMDGLVDIYMPDFKFWSGDSARRLCKAEDYPARAREAIAEMHRQVGDLKFTPDGLACRGLLIRHLVMPGLLDESRAIFRWLAEEISPDTFINIMGQYRPEHRVGHDERYGDINRCPTRQELQAARDAAAQAGLWRFDER